MKLKDRNYIKTRLRYLQETSEELKGEFKKTKNPLLEDLYLEIECYTNEINVRLNRIERGSK
jgi:hypothetical protein